MIDSDSKHRFQSLCDEHIRRDGIHKLMDWLEKSDFYTAPASTRYHGSHAGGLLEHSLNVYDALKDLCALHAGRISATDESIAIVSLFHDLCKVNFYKPDTRNVKVNGVWTAVPTYTIEEKFAYGGHGSKSVFLVERFIRLEPEEAVAINCHMGAWDGDKYVSSVYERSPLAFLLHVADETASFMMENAERQA